MVRSTVGRRAGADCCSAWQGISVPRTLCYASGEGGRDLLHLVRRSEAAVRCTLRWMGTGTQPAMLLLAWQMLSLAGNCSAGRLRVSLVGGLGCCRQLCQERFDRVKRRIVPINDVGVHCLTWKDTRALTGRQPCVELDLSEMRHER